MFAGVVEQVADDPFEPARLGLDDDRRIGHRAGRRVGEPGTSDRPDQPPEIDGLGRDLLGGRVEPRQLHQVVHQGSQTGDVGHEQLAGAAAVGRQVVEVLAQDRRLGDEGSERRPELVRHVRDEPPVLRLGGLEPARSSRSSAAAIRLNRSAHAPNSSREVTGTRAE